MSLIIVLALVLGGNDMREVVAFAASLSFLFFHLHTFHACRRIHLLLESFSDSSESFGSFYLFCTSCCSIVRVFAVTAPPSPKSP